MASLLSRLIVGALGLLSLVSSACGGSPNDEGSSGGSSGRGGSGEPTPGGPGAGGSSGSSASGGSAAGSSGSDSSGSGGGGSGTLEVVPSAGCDRAPGLSSGERSIEVNGVTRTFIVDVPSDYDESTPYPLLFGFHGRGFTGAEFRSASYGNLLSVAGDSAILVHPDALGDAELAWDVESLADVRFFDALLEELTSELCVDESRVFAAGHSSGAYFVNLLGCVRGDSLRAIAPVAGGGPFGSGGGAPSCEGSLSVWIAHAEDDETVLFQNGENSRDYWLASDSCSEDRVDDVTPSPCVAYEGCDAGLAVNWCAYAGGHDWPSFGARGIWSFFQQF